MAGRLRTVFNARDLEAFAALMAPWATWGDDPDSPGYCHDRDQIIATYRRLLDGGVSGTIVDTTAGPKGVACLLEVQWSDVDGGRGPNFYQVFLVADGLVVHIESHHDKDSALAAVSG